MWGQSADSKAWPHFSIMDKKGETEFIASAGKEQLAILSCNLCHNGQQALDSYHVFEVGGKKVALVGITPPRESFKATPSNFYDENGELTWSIDGGFDGADLYALGPVRYCCRHPGG